MRRILWVARAEASALVRSKAFLVSVVLVPLFVVGMSTVQTRLGRSLDDRPRRVGIVDAAGGYGPLLATVAAAPRPGQPPLAVEPIALGAQSLDDLRLTLSDRVRAGSLDAFLEIPATVGRDADAVVRVYGETAAARDVSERLITAVDTAVRQRRLADAGVRPEVAQTIEQHVRGERLSLVERGPDGRVAPARKIDLVRDLLVPGVPPLFLFFFVVLSGPQLMNAVLVEKMSRISEVLLGSASAFEIMAGKLLGSVAVSLLLGCIYMSGGLLTAHRLGLLAVLSPGLLAWFVLFLVLAMLLYGSICLAVGAACNDLKDAQNLMMPVMLPLMLPLFLASSVLQAPDGRVAVAGSLFPFSAPLLMLLRLGLHPRPPAWQVAVAVAGVLLAVVATVWAGSRIFRVGLLTQGRSASVAEMLRWVWRRD